MKSNDMEKYFTILKQQRGVFYQDWNFNQAWERPLSDKWSIGETLYHLLLMVRLFRRFSTFYIPIMIPLGYLRKKRPYKTKSNNIYEEYKQNKNRPMNAPPLIIPPSGLAKKWNISEIMWQLDYETERLQSFINSIDQDVAGQIYYPDPIAHYPNLIQSIHLLAVHEQHHFQLTKKYYLDA